jgi:hypothetical protein
MRYIVLIVCLLVSGQVVQGATYFENFNSIPLGPLAQRTVGPVTVTFATGTYTAGSFSVLDAFAGHHSQLEPSRLLANLDVLLTFNVPLSEFSILDDPATNEPGANQINVIGLANDFSVITQGTFPNDQLPQSRVTVTGAGMWMVVLDFLPITGISDDEGFDDMILTPVPEPASLGLAVVGAVVAVGFRCYSKGSKLAVAIDKSARSRQQRVFASPPIRN